MDFMERPLGLENVSSYVAFTESTMEEWEFLARIAEKADCGILLDVNNIHVSSVNHDYASMDFVHAIPPDRILQYHLAGHTDKGTHLLDTHNDHVIDAVWDLYRESFQRTGGRNTLLEWDEDIPSFDVVHAEALKAKQFRTSKTEKVS